MDGWQRAFVLHSRPWSETSLMLDVFTEESGRVRLVAKGARSKRSNLKGALQPFTPYWFASAAAAKSKPCAAREAVSLALPLSGITLYSGLYVNELISRVLEHETRFSNSFLTICTAFRRLPEPAARPEPALRRFELALLGHLGYGVDFLHCAGSGEPVDDTMTYRYREERGFIASLVIDNNTFTGHHLKALASREFPDVDTLRAAKRFYPYRPETLSWGQTRLRVGNCFASLCPRERRGRIIRIMINEDCHG
ncbi:DNA repair protein RecO [Klebsiella variicola subsp. variicola]|nr:DNA repair protein RecO [Klebsiella variicola subsp. variicola]